MHFGKIKAYRAPNRHIVGRGYFPSRPRGGIFLRLAGNIERTHRRFFKHAEFLVEIRVGIKLPPLPKTAYMRIVCRRYRFFAPYCGFERPRHIALPAKHPNFADENVAKPLCLFSVLEYRHLQRFFEAGILSNTTLHSPSADATADFLCPKNSTSTFAPAFAVPQILTGFSRCNTILSEITRGVFISPYPENAKNIIGSESKESFDRIPIVFNGLKEVLLRTNRELHRQAILNPP